MARDDTCRTTRELVEKADRAFRLLAPLAQLTEKLGKFDDIEREIEAAEVRLAKARQAEEEHRAGVAAERAAQLAELDGKLTSLQGEIAEATTQAASARARLGELDAVIRERTTELSGVEGRLAKARAQAAVILNG